MLAVPIFRAFISPSLMYIALFLFFLPFRLSPTINLYHGIRWLVHVVRVVFSTLTWHCAAV